jgi:hypothetical protein
MSAADYLLDKPLLGAKGTNSGVDFDIKKQTLKIYNTGENLGDGGSDVKKTVLENWYKQLPYGFKFRDMIFYLPISPSNLNITTHFATNMISTMYGTVEEHSEQRYYDITISGTTGMSPRYYESTKTQLTDKIVGRAMNPVKSRIAGIAGGFMKRTQSLIENTVQQASDLVGEPAPSSGIDLRRTGYAAFHNFYKFLLLHKKVATGQVKIGSGSKNLIFLNYKDNNQYNVVIQTFQLTRDASNPMLYNYNISMRGYNLIAADTENIGLDVANRLNNLGLNGIHTSLATQLANKARKAKNAAYSAIAAAKGFGA